MTERTSSSVLTAPLRGAASVLGKVPGASTVGRAAQETLDMIGAVSPRGRRFLVYTGASVLGAAGVVEWPVALTGAAVAWLTQPRPSVPVPAEDGVEENPDATHDLGAAALRSGNEPQAHQEPPGPVKAPHGRGATGPLGPTARPDRTSL